MHQNIHAALERLGFPEGMKKCWNLESTGQKDTGRSPNIAQSV